MNNTVFSILLKSFSLSSDTLLFFLPWVVLIYYIVSLWNGKKAFLLLVSMAFYWLISQFSFEALSFILALSGINFLLVFWLQKIKNRFLLSFIVLLNLLVLILFKYIPQTKEIITSFTNIVQFIGLSFYVFNVISVSADIQSEKIKEPIQFLDFLNFLLYFPKIITGPLTRYNEFIQELNREILTEEFVMQGIGLLIIGLLKKGLADFIGQYPTAIYANPQGYSGFEHLFAMYGYAIYIFLDFSAYTDMARGISRVFGIELPINFNSPYRALSMSDFWHKWHISLSLWIKDYIYIPLGGSRRGRIRTYMNIIIAFILSGVWHGVGLNFVLWGFLHGIGVAVHKVFSNRIKLFALMSWFLTFHWVMIGWIIFANPLSNAWISILQITTAFDPEKILSILMNNPLWYATFTAAFFYSLWDMTIVEKAVEFFSRLYFFWKLVVFIVALYLIIMSHNQVVHTFIYQNF
jgi:D-alanyl-lipoteichoic acid acyltransferase DltB (MBOAT superfamily)